MCEVSSEGQFERANYLRCFSCLAVNYLNINLTSKVSSGDFSFSYRRVRGGIIEKGTDRFKQRGEISLGDMEMGNDRPLHLPKSPHRRINRHLVQKIHP